jgi:hypothetical protein
MDSAHIADRIPNKFFSSLDFNFFVDSSHSVCSDFSLNYRDLPRAVEWLQRVSSFRAQIVVLPYEREESCCYL